MNPPNNYNSNDRFKAMESRLDEQLKRNQIEHDLKMAEVERKLAEAETANVRLQGMEQRSQSRLQEYKLYLERHQAWSAQCAAIQQQYMHNVVSQVVMQFIQYQQQSDQKMLAIQQQIIGLNQSILEVDYSSKQGRLSLAENIHLIDKSNQEKFNKIGEAFNAVGQKFNQLDSRFLQQEESIRELSFKVKEHQQHVVGLLQEFSKDIQDFKIHTSKALHQFEMKQGQFMNQVEGRIGKAENRMGAFVNQIGSKLNQWEKHFTQYEARIDRQIATFSNDAAGRELKLEAEKIKNRLTAERHENVLKLKSLASKEQQMKDGEKLRAANYKISDLQRDKERAEWLASPKFKNAKHKEEVDNLRSSLSAAHSNHKDQVEELQRRHREELGNDAWIAHCKGKGLDPQATRKDNPLTYLKWLENYRKKF